MVTASVSAAATTLGPVAGKERLVGEKEIVGVPATVATRGTYCGTYCTVVTTKVTLLGLVAVVGVKLMAKLQLAPAAKVLPQVWPVTLNSEAPRPVNA